MYRLIQLFLTSQLILGWSNTLLAEQIQSATHGSTSNWRLLAGIGRSHPGWGDTQERVETADLILRHERPQSVVRGRGWYRNRHSLLIETAFHYLTSPNEPPMLGLYFQTCWTFESSEELQPYLFFGGGPVYSRAKIPGTSSSFKGSYQAGAGMRFTIGGHEFSLDYRFHHLSNGGIEQPNDPLNSDKLLLGMKLPY